MKTGIPCNELELHNINTTRSISYHFVTDDGNTPSACTVRLGDTDPFTGKEITDIDFFREYYREANKEAYQSMKGIRPAMSGTEKEELRQERKKIAEDFRYRHGYEPNTDTVRYLQEERRGSRYHISIEAFADEEECFAGSVSALADTAAEKALAGNESDEIAALREVASSLTGRLKDVYEMMLVRYAGGKVRITGKELAQKWHVSDMQISRDQKKIMEMIREKVTEYLR